MDNQIKNIAFYHFFKPSFDLEIARLKLRSLMNSFGIKGSILLANEGINSFVAGPNDKIDLFMKIFLEIIQVTDPSLKISYSKTIPFKRAIVKIKSFIVPEPGVEPVDLAKNCAPHLSPEELQQWIKEGKKMVILDARNDYEYEIGRFKDSVHLGTQHFSDFEASLEKAPQEWIDTPVVTFCTGGIRCEKAAPLMIKKGFRKVYQLDGGILNYFEKIGRGDFEGDCFVFDLRNALNDQLTPSASTTASATHEQN